MIWSVIIGIVCTASKQCAWLSAGVLGGAAGDWKDI